MDGAQRRRERRCPPRLYAADDRTLDLFRPLAEHFLPAMEASVFAAGWEGGGDGPSVQLSAASFISILGADAGVTDDIARWHEDWGPCGDHEAFSVLMPLRRVDAAARAAFAARALKRPTRDPRRGRTIVAATAAGRGRRVAAAPRPRRGYSVESPPRP